MLYWLYLAGFGLTKILPIRACYALAELIARVYFIASRRDREALKNNLKIILGDGTDDEILTRHVLGIFRNFAKYLADFFKFACIDRSYIDKYVKVEGSQYIDKCLSEGKGAICLALHLGNWELGGFVLAALGYPANAIVLKHADKRINDLFTRRREQNKLCNIPVGMSVKNCFKALRGNEVVAIVGDKDYTSSGEYVDFFGRKALMPKGPAVISLKTGAPLVITYLSRGNDDTFRLTFEEPIKYTPTGNMEKDTRELMGTYLKEFERVIREYPDQWYAFKPVWGNGGNARTPGNSRQKAELEA